MTSLIVRARALFLLFLTSHCSGCVGTFDTSGNTPPQLAPSTTRAHCVALDAESDWMPGVAAGFGAAGTGLGVLGATDKGTQAERVAGVVLGAAGLVAGGVGVAASKSWHEQCALPTGAVK